MLANIPNWESASSELTRISFLEAETIYGRPLPVQVERRITEEISAITRMGYEGIYLINYEMMRNSGIDKYDCYYIGYACYSFVAYLLGLTNTINPLEPHYRFRHADYSEFPDYQKFKSCFDMQEKKCPVCGARLEKDGYNLDFDMSPFRKDDLAFDFEISVPHIKSREMVEGLKKCKHLHRIIRHGEAKNGDIIPFSGEENQRGYYLIPFGKENLIDNTKVYKYKGEDIINWFNGDMPDGFYTEWILENKATDLLYCLYDYSGVSPKLINIFDENILGLFSSGNTDYRKGENLTCTKSTLGIPGFGHEWLVDILYEMQPRSIGDLIKICGLLLSEGTWLENAKDLLESGVASLEEVVSTWDDVYEDCIQRGIGKKRAYEIAESVRHGDGLNHEMEQQMKSVGFDIWYIDSCKKIERLCCRGQCLVVVLKALRTAYYKLYFPEDFYNAYFDTMVSEDIRRKLLDGEENNMHMLDDMWFWDGSDDFDFDLREALMVAEEMYDRRIDVL